MLTSPLAAVSLLPTRKMPAILFFAFIVSATFGSLKSLFTWDPRLHVELDAPLTTTPMSVVTPLRFAPEALQEHHQRGSICGPLRKKDLNWQSKHWGTDGTQLLDECLTKSLSNRVCCHVRMQPVLVVIGSASTDSSHSWSVGFARTQGVTVLYPHLGPLGNSPVLPFTLDQQDTLAAWIHNSALFLEDSHSHSHSQTNDTFKSRRAFGLASRTLITPFGERQAKWLKDNMPSITNRLLAPPQSAYATFEGADNGKAGLTPWLLQHGFEKYAIKEWTSAPSDTTAPYPLMAKPVIGTWSRGVQRVNNTSEAEAVLKRKPAVFQEIINGTEWGVYMTALNGRRLHVWCKKYFDYDIRQGGDGVILPCSELTGFPPTEVDRILATTNYTGLGCLGLKVRNSGPNAGTAAIFDFNTRMGGPQATKYLAEATLAFARAAISKNETALATTTANPQQANKSKTQGSNVFFWCLTVSLLAFAVYPFL